MLWFCCGGRQPNRYQHHAEQTLKRLQISHDAQRAKGRVYAAVALAKKREAAEHYRQGNTYEAMATAMEARTHEEMAMRFLKMVESTQGTIREINRQWAAFEKLDSATATAQDFAKLGIVQKRELDGTDELPSLDARIDAANKMLDDFKRLVEETDTQMKEVVTGSGGDDNEDLLREIQRWGLGQLQGPPEPRNLTPDQLEMSKD